MRGTLLIYAPGGSLLTREIGKPTLDLLKTAIGGGYLESIPYWRTIEHGGKVIPCAAFCDDDGKRKGLAVNARATFEWDAAMRREVGCGCAPDFLVGPIVVAFGDRQFMEAM